MDPIATLAGIIAACNDGDRDLLNELIEALDEWNRKQGYLPNITQTLTHLKRANSSTLFNQKISIEIPQNVPETNQLIDQSLPVLEFDYDEQEWEVEADYSVTHSLTLWQIAECVAYKALAELPELDQNKGSEAFQAAIAGITKQSALTALKEVAENPTDFGYLLIESLLEETWMHKSPTIVGLVRSKLMDVFHLETKSDDS